MKVSEEKFGDLFRRLRRDKGFKSQKTLASVSGVSQTTISRIEDGTQTPQNETLKALAEALNVPYFDLLVLAGHVAEDDMLETKEELINQYMNSQEIKKESKTKETPISHSTEKEFLNNLELSDTELLDQFDLKLDGESLTENEAKAAIAYLRTLRGFDK